MLLVTKTIGACTKNVGSIQFLDYKKFENTSEAFKTSLKFHDHDKQPGTN